MTSSPICSVWAGSRYVHGPCGADRGPQQRSEDVAHPAQPRRARQARGAVPQHLAEPLVSEQQVRRPVAASSNSHIDGVTTPAIGPTVGDGGRGRGSPPAGLKQRRGVLGVVGQALEGGAAHERPAQRAGCPVPADRRAGVQELARSGRAARAGRHVTRVAVTLEQRGHRLRVGPLGAGRRAPWPGRPRCPSSGGRQSTWKTGTACSASASASRAAPTLTTAAASNAVAAWRTSSPARRVARALDRCTSAPPSASARTWRSRP